MGYKSGWNKQMHAWWKSNQGTTTHVPAVAQPWTWDTLGIKRWKTTGEKWVKGQEQTEDYTESGRKWDQKTASWIKNKYSWIDDDRIPSQAEIDWYAAQEAGEDPPEITQEHLDAIGMGEGGEGLTVDDVGKGDDPHWSDPTLGGGGYDNAPGTTDPKSEHNPYIDPVTGEKKFQTREEWSASIGDDAISVGPTDEDSYYGGKGFASRTKGGNPYLKIKKKSKGGKGKFTRGSLRVRKPKRMAV